MDIPRKRRSEAASLICAERTYCKSKELNYISGCWSEKPFLLKLALTTLLAMALLLLPLYLSFNTSSLRERLIGSSLVAAIGTSFVAVVLLLQVYLNVQPRDGLMDLPRLVFTSLFSALASGVKLWSET